MLRGRNLAITGIVLGLVIVILNIGLIISFRTYYRAFKTPSNSMVPTIKKGDRFFVSRKAYASRSPLRGEIVVISTQQEGKKQLRVSRVVGLPGESIEIINGKIYINGDSVAIPDLPESIFYLNKGSYGKKGQTTKIPKNHFYLLSDNSAESFDSRYVGVISVNDIYGKVIFSYVGFPYKQGIELLEQHLKQRVGEGE